LGRVCREGLEGSVMVTVRKSEGDVKGKTETGNGTGFVALCVEGVPAGPKKFPHWACWQETPDGNKPPINATAPYDGRVHRYASPTDPSSWTSFTRAVDYWSKYLRNAGPPSGVSLALTGPLVPGGNSLVGIDLDDAIDPKSGIKPWAADIIRTFNT